MNIGLLYPKRWLGTSFLFLCTVSALAQELLDPKTQPQFVNPLPIPSVIDGRNGGFFTIGISQFEQWLGLRHPTTGQSMLTKVWGYNQSYPGPTLLARRNAPIDVFWRNNLVDGSNRPLPHLLPIDPTLHWALEDVSNWQQAGVPVVTHLHGGHTESASDGLPEAWFTPHFALKGEDFVKGDVVPYHYTNDQEAATLWYHDHALGITRLNVYAGLAGFYLLTDENESELQANGKLPGLPYDIGLAIQDRSFRTDGQLFYPAEPEDADDPNPSIIPEFFGQFILVNGMTWPVLEVEPRQYRFRLLNGSDSRFYTLFLSSGQPFQQIATDNGLLPAPVPLDQLLIAPGERKEVILDFSNPALWGQTIILRNHAKEPFPRGNTVDPQTTGRIMAFKVNKTLNPNYPLTTLPSTLRLPIERLQSTLPPRKLILFEATDEYGRLKPMLGTVENGVMQWHDPITENPMLNSTEIWEIHNETEDAHPIHLHLVRLQLVNRQKFKADINPENGHPENIRYLGQPKSPAPDEQGWKDTWVMYPGEVTRVIATFDIEGEYAWHCHILSHEDHEMMRPYYVGEMPEGYNKQQAKDAMLAAPISEKKDAALTVWPNPGNQNFYAKFYVFQSAPVTISIYDIKGKLLKRIERGSVNEGWQQISINSNNWVSGVYYCEVLIAEQKHTEKIILQK
jgi:spore coat protein A, manganese oxidase